MIPFTQYLRPDGRTRQITIDVNDVVGRMAEGLMRRGLCFEAEILTTGEVSLTISDSEQDLAIEVVPNGPEVLRAVDRLIQKVTESEFKGPECWR